MFNRAIWRVNTFVALAGLIKGPEGWVALTLFALLIIGAVRGWD